MRNKRKKRREKKKRKKKARVKRMRTTSPSPLKALRPPPSRKPGLAIAASPRAGANRFRPARTLRNAQ